MKQAAITLMLCLLLAGCAAKSRISSSREATGIDRLEPFRQEDRVLILAPHPDDETIGCAGIIQEAKASGAQVRVAFLTNGEHNQVAFIVYEKRLTLRRGEFIHMGEVRRRESIKAMKSLGLLEKDLVFLGYPDFGTFNIFSNYWKSKRPFKSWLTRISAVPYKENLSFGAPYVGESILSDLKTVLRGYKPTKIFVSHPADVNVDHRSFYLFLQVALWDLAREIPAPKVYPYLIHCVGWPKPRHYHPQLSLLPPAKFKDSSINWLGFSLAPSQLDIKHKAILCYKSQTESSAFYLLAFARKNELFGDYPAIQLERQRSSSGRTVLYSGISDMYRDYEAELEESEPQEKHINKVSYAVVDDNFVAHIEKGRELNNNFSLTLYIFGYSKKTLFAEMPKIRLVMKNTKFMIFDGKKKIASEGVSIDLNQEAVTIKIPLKLLGEPELILTSFKAHWGMLPVDASAFRKIEIQ